MKSKIFIFFSILYLAGSNAFCQSIQIEAQNEPLNMVLIQVRDSYGVQLSFDDRKLSKYKINLSKNFNSPDEAIGFLLKDLPLSYEKSGDVYLIFTQKNKQKVAEYIVSGKILDKENFESLPFSHVIINGRGMVTDFKGSFSFISKTDSVFHMSISYLGYYILDTLVLPGANQTFYLAPSVIGIKEVVIEGEVVEHSGQVGESPGAIRLNHKIASRVPGNGDNSVFNYLRLQPGILAAGEQSSDLIIWGGYEGHSQVLFDGFTVYGLKNFNDNISAVNPYMAKDILVLKGGYGADYGERVGGIVNISGIDGNPIDPSLNFTINNMTISGKASIPVFQKSSLIFAFRHTYYNLYNEDDVNFFNNNSSSDQTDIDVNPDYLFRDFNLKYSGSTSNGDNYFLSLYEGRDNFSYRIDEANNNVRVFRQSEERSRQRGGSLYYGKNWKKGFQSNILLSFSGLDKELFLEQEVTRVSTGNVVQERDELLQNQIQEVSLKNQNQFAVSDGHQIDFGMGYTYNDIGFEEDSTNITISKFTKFGQRVHLFLQDEVTLNKYISIKPGIRIDYAFNLDKSYIQPRLLVSIKFDEYLKLHGAWGIYNQFISLTSEVDDQGNYRYFWTVCDNDEIPVLNAQHFVGGLTYQNRNFIASIEAYYKTITGITRFINTNKFFEKGIYEGSGYSYGMDLFLKKMIRKHEFWISYSLGKTEETFPYFRYVDYWFAPQDQRHEVKVAGLFNFHPIYISSNYVYGSGFVDLARSSDPDNRYPYSRLDAAFIYRYDRKKFQMEAGLSILNVLNTKNIKYSNFIRVPANQLSSINIHAEAVPFTPTIYLNFSF